jgi:hypothetical protein
MQDSEIVSKAVELKHITDETGKLFLDCLQRNPELARQGRDEHVQQTAFERHSQGHWLSRTGLHRVALQVLGDNSQKQCCGWFSFENLRPVCASEAWRSTKLRW